MSQMHSFSAVPKAEIQRSRFDRSHTYKTSSGVDTLIPFLVDEVLPGDTFDIRATLFGRLSTPVAPAMDNMHVDTFFFFVPARLLWQNWTKFHGEQDNPGDSTDFLVPTVSIDSVEVGSIADYMGIRAIAFDDSISVNILPYRAYRMIYHEWFRDQNLTQAYWTRGVSDTDTGDDATFMPFHVSPPYYRCKRHDYFTSCLPWPQKGDAVTIPFTGTVPIEATSSAGLTFNFVNGDIANLYVENPLNTTSGHYPVTAATFGHVPSLPSGDYLSGISNIIADFSNAGITSTINQLRQAFQIQRLIERDARGGTRYTEILNNHFGVLSPDSRLQRPEFLGGGSQRLNLTPVQQTSSSDATTPQGNLAAYGVTAGSNHVAVKSFVEHGYLIGLYNVRSDVTYSQGINKLWSRQTRYDFYYPALAHLGEQAVLGREIYATGNAAGDSSVFGYQERWAEYRYKPSMLTSLMRPTSQTSVNGDLGIWNYSEYFSTRPSLNNNFILANTPIERVLAVPSEAQNAAVIMDIHVNMKCTRPMPIYSVPGLIDHF